jgi:hypothetical protein
MFKLTNLRTKEVTVDALVRFSTKMLAKIPFYEEINKKQIASKVTPTNFIIMMMLHTGVVN